VELVDAHHEDVDLLGRVVTVELLAPQLGIHLLNNIFFVKSIIMTIPISF
jgi:hypothetical protein